jgi:hypothetical protein
MPLKLTYDALPCVHAELDENPEHMRPQCRIRDAKSRAGYLVGTLGPERFGNLHFARAQGADPIRAGLAANRAGRAWHRLQNRWPLWCLGFAHRVSLRWRAKASHISLSVWGAAFRERPRARRFPR